ncbi:MAG: sugar ABC transporter ATP-binding protein [Bacillota bacterium]
MNGNRLEMLHINKTFPGVHALKDVNFSLRVGEIHGLIGENGAGKSTLMKVLGGVEIPDSGEIYIDNEQVRFTNPKDAQDKEISFIHQELSLFLDLDIATNLYIQNLPVKHNIIQERTLRKKAEEVLEQVGLGKHNPKELVKNLTMGERQLVEIARCLIMNTKILVLDEPTSSLTKKEVNVLFSLMRRLKSQGISIIFISHRMDEVFDICDRLTVMRDGRIIATKDIKDCTTPEVVRLIIGRELNEMYDREYQKPGKELLRVVNLNRGEKFRNVSFTVHEGEIVGLYGLLGSGRSEVVRSIFGVEKFDSGEIYMEGKKLEIHMPLDAIESGIGLVTENRREEGLMLQQSVQFNLVSANLPAYAKSLGFIDRKKEVSACKDNIQTLNIKTPSMRKIVQYLSGGNQQKVVIAKWLNRSPKVLILDEPTRGIDVGAKHEIYNILSDLVKANKGVLIISSELNEILGLSDRIIVLRKGAIVAEFKAGEFSKDKLLEASMGGLTNEN